MDCSGLLYAGALPDLVAKILKKAKHYNVTAKKFSSLKQKLMGTKSHPEMVCEICKRKIAEVPVKFEIGHSAYRLCEICRTRRNSLLRKNVQSKNFRNSPLLRRRWVHTYLWIFLESFIFMQARIDCFRTQAGRLETVSDQMLFPCSQIMSVYLFFRPKNRICYYIIII